MLRRVFSRVHCVRSGENATRSLWKMDPMTEGWLESTRLSLTECGNDACPLWEGRGECNRKFEEEVHCDGAVFGVYKNAIDMCYTNAIDICYMGGVCNPIVGHGK